MNINKEKILTMMPGVLAHLSINICCIPKRHGIIVKFLFRKTICHADNEKAVSQHKTSILYHTLCNILYHLHNQNLYSFQSLAFSLLGLFLSQNVVREFSFIYCYAYFICFTFADFFFGFFRLCLISLSFSFPRFIASYALLCLG